MIRARRAAGLVAVVVIAAVSSAAAVFLFERVPVQVRGGASEAARGNPYLALQQFLVRGPQPVRQAEHSRVIDSLDRGDALVIDLLTVPLTRTRQDQLLAWVGRGGYLVLMLDGEPDDSWLLGQLGIVPCAIDDEFETTCPGFPAPDGVIPDEGEPVSVVRLPGSARPLVISDIGVLGVTVPYAWKGTTGGVGPSLVHVRHGDGQVTVGTGLRSIWANDAIGEHNHATLLAWLLQTYAGDGAVVVLTRGEELAATLATPFRAAWPLLVGLGVTALAAIWSAWPRFGAVRDGRRTDRRQLAEHLDAVGRYVADVGGDDVWLDEVRRHCRARLQHRHPALATLPVAGQVAAISTLTRLPATSVQEALVGSARSSDDFVTRMRHLHEIEEHL